MNDNVERIRGMFGGIKRIVREHFRKRRKEDLFQRRRGRDGDSYRLRVVSVFQLLEGSQWRYLLTAKYTA